MGITIIAMLNYRWHWNNLHSCVGSVNTGTHGCNSMPDQACRLFDPCTLVQCRADSARQTRGKHDPCHRFYMCHLLVQGSPSSTMTGMTRNRLMLSFNSNSEQRYSCFDPVGDSLCRWFVDHC